MSTWSELAVDCAVAASVPVLHRDQLHVDPELRPLLAAAGLRELEDFLAFSGGSVVSRRRKRDVRRLELEVEGERRRYFLKQGRREALSATFAALRLRRPPRAAGLRERQLVERFRTHGIPVMRPVAWGERRLLGWPVSGFILVEEVVGRRFIDAYRESSLRARRRLLRAHGALMGRLHCLGIDSKVRPADLICATDEISGSQPNLVVIDREYGAREPIQLSGEQRGQGLADIWVKGALSMRLSEAGQRSELLAFLAGYLRELYLDTRPERHAEAERLAGQVTARACEIVRRDGRFESLRPGFEKWCGAGSPSKRA